MMASLLSFASPLRADTYPDHVIRLVVPTAAGGAMDIAARLLQPYLEQLGKPVIIENRAGASTIIGVDMVAKAKPDGHTILLTASTFTVNAAVQRKLPYDTVKDFAPIGLIGTNSLLFLVNPKVRVNNLAELVALAKANPGKLNYATPGADSQAHLLIESWCAQVGIRMQQIPYRGGAPTVMSTIAGDTQFTLMSPLAVVSQVESGALRAIATGGPERDPQFPSVPTTREAGFPDLKAVQWLGLLTTAGTPKDIVDKLNATINRALRDPDLKKKLAEQGVLVAGGTSEDFRKRIIMEVKSWTDIARAANVRSE
jgi:tripartite-type tricarboxylate transporter receptor subunit TctC